MKQKNTLAARKHSHDSTACYDNAPQSAAETIAQVFLWQSAKMDYRRQNDWTGLKCLCSSSDMGPCAQRQLPKTIQQNWMGIIYMYSCKWNF